MDITYRFENPNDIAGIEEVTKNAFLDHPHGSGSETLIINALRNDNALELSLVAEHNGNIIGHIAFSKVSISDGTTGWFALGPVSVLKEHQCHGIGTALINMGLKQLKEKGAGGCVLLGEPDYYRRFGFTVSPELTLEGFPPEYFQSLLINGHMPNGNVVYHKSFLN